MAEGSREGTRTHGSGIWFVLASIAWFYRMADQGNPEGALAVITLLGLGFWAGMKGFE